MQKTVFIFDTCGESNIRFYVADGEFSHFNNAYISGGDNTKELFDLFYDEDGEEKLESLDVFPYDAVKNGAKVVVVGFVF